MRTGAVIPAFNVGDRLNNVLFKTLQFIPAQNVYVVDDGSTDGTSEIGSRLGVTVLHHATNRGKGEALKTGFRQCLRDGLDVTFTIDGDGQHDPCAIPAFLETMEADQSDVVVGLRRFTGCRMPWDRICSNGISSLITSFIAGFRVKDSQCGFRLIRTEVLQSLPLRSKRYELETELLIRALWMGFQISHCPVQVTYADEPSHIRRWTDTVRFCRLWIRLIRERMGSNIR